MINRSLKVSAACFSLPYTHQPLTAILSNEEKGSQLAQTLKPKITLTIPTFKVHDCFEVGIARVIFSLNVVLSSRTHTHKENKQQKREVFQSASQKIQCQRQSVTEPCIIYYMHFPSPHDKCKPSPKLVRAPRWKGVYV